MENYYTKRGLLTEAEILKLKRNHTAPSHMTNTICRLRVEACSG
jgi:hypothetical protein